MKRSLTFAAALLSLYFLSSCAPSISQQKPPEISYGLDVCEQCRMLIDSPEFSAGFTTPSGRAHKFDDIGCMLTFIRKHPEENPGHNAVYVADYKTKTLVDGKKVFFVRAKKVSTPMGYGIIAFENKSSARAFPLQSSDQILSYDEVNKISQLKTEPRDAKAVKK